MDSVLFIPSIWENDWVRKILPGKSAAELPIAGMRYIDYAIEEAIRLGAGICEVFDWTYSTSLAEYFSDPTRTSHPVFYEKGQGPHPMGLDSLTDFKTPLTGTIEDGLIVVWGLCVTSHELQETRLVPATEEECRNTPPGAYVRRNGRWMKSHPPGICISDADTWHRVNFAILRNPGSFTLPGYSAENGVYLGHNVVLEHGTEVKPPVLLEDNIWCARNVTLAGDVIVESGAFIGEGAYLKRTLVCADTYIGTGLDLTDKIVVGRRIIDPASGAWTDIEEKGVARGIGESRVVKLLRGMWRFLKGKSYGRRG